MLPTLLIALAANAAAVAATPSIETDPRKMTSSQIRAHNATLARTDPDYIRCVVSEDTGSLVRKRASCRSNAEWKLADRVGNDNARETVEAMTGKAVNTGN